MGSHRNKYNFIGEKFVIENNVHKGEKKDLDLSASGVGEVILNHLKKTPSKIGQIDADTQDKTTFAEMRENMIRCAIWLKKQCITKGDVISVCTYNQIDAYVPCFGAFLVGAVYNPWHHEVTLKMARHLMTLMKPKIIFACESAVKVLTEAATLEKLYPQFIVFENDPDLYSLQDLLELQTPEEIENFKPEPVKDSDTTSMVLFSSGSTGLPKGVALSYDFLMRTIINVNLIPNMESVTLLNYSSLYWISGTLFMILTLMNTGTRIIHTDTDLEEICKVIQKYKVSTYCISPSTMAYLVKSKVLRRYKLESVQTCVATGSKISRQILEEFKSSLPHVHLIQAYGLTETGGPVLLQTRKCKGIESVGFVAANIEAEVVDVDNGETLGPNQPGEVLIKTPLTMMGYYNNPAATKSTINKEGWVQTGDKGYYTEEGEFYIIDRIKDVMKFRGHQVSPSELEEVILNHVAIMEVAVVPLPHDLDLEHPMAFVKRRPGFKITEEEIVNMTAALGENKKLWGGVKFVDEMPYTATGKINRKDLKEMAKSLSTSKI